jgi:Stage II sporulation protein M
MNVSRLAVVQGMDDTRAALRRWNAAPLAAVRPWALGAGAVSVGLLCAVWVIAHATTPDPTGYLVPGLNAPATLTSVGRVLFRNSLVLTLHAMACIAGFIAGSSLPLEAERYGGAWRWIHDRTGPLAIAFVAAATAFSLLTQSYALGMATSTLADQLDVSPGLLLFGLMPHALPELVALFLPLAAWILASRRGDWHKLLAATFVTGMLAVPVLVAAAFVEVYVTPGLLRALAG